MSYQSPYLRGQKQRHSNPSFLSNEIFYGSMKTNDTFVKSIDFSSKKQKQQERVSYQSSYNQTEKKLPTHNFDDTQTTTKKHQLNKTMDQKDLISLQNNNKSDNKNINQSFQQQQKQKSKSPNQQQQQSKYTQLLPDHHRYERMTALENNEVNDQLALQKSQYYQKSSIAQFENEGVQQYQQRIEQEQREIQRQRTTVSPYANKSTQQYLQDYYKKNKYSRVNGKLQLTSRSICDYSQIKEQKQSQQLKTPQNNKTKIIEDLQSQCSQQQQSDKKSVRSIRSSKSMNSQTASSIMSNILLCEPCYGNDLERKKQDKKLLEKQRDREIVQTQQQIYEQGLKIFKENQQNVYNELNLQMNNYFQKKQNPLEQYVNQHNQEVDSHKEIVKEQNRLNQELRNKAQQKKQSIRQDLSQTYSNQMQYKQDQKQQEKVQELQYAIDQKFEDMKKQKALQRQQKQKQNLANVLQQQLEFQKQQDNQAKQDKKDFGALEKQLIDQYNQIQQQRNQQKNQMMKQHGNQIKGAIQYNESNKQNQERKELQEAKRQIREVERLNKKLQEQGLLKMLENKRKMKGTLQTQIEYKKNKDEAEKRDNKYNTTLQLKLKPQSQTKECNSCHKQVVIERLINMKKQKQQQ